MPFDSLTYALAAKELNNALKNGRIERVGMPNKDDVIFTVRPASNGEKRASVLLLVSADPSRPRAYITTESAENPLSAYAFLMHLRKRIGGGTITDVTSVTRERIINVGVEAYDELGYKKRYTLRIELLGRFSNVILTDENDVITDALKRISFDDFSARAVLPGMKYTLPPAQDGKVSPDDTAAVTALLSSFDGGKLSDYLMRGVYGFAPVTMREIVYKAYGTTTPAPELVRNSPEKLIRAINDMNEANAPCVKIADGKPADCFVAPFISDDGEYESYPSLNAAIAAYYSAKAEHTYMSGKTAHLTTIVKNAIKKNAKSLALFRERELESGDYENDRITGELLTANLYRIKQGMREIEVDDYYTGKRVVIPLDEQLSPQKNAQKYYKTYSKKKTALAKSREQAQSAEERSDYLDSLLIAIENCENESDIADVTAEMESAGLIKRSGSKKKNKPSSPVKLTVDGLQVLIGKNNIQNDALVRSSDGGWLWLHAQKIHGSHAVIKSTSVPQDTINKVAAYVAHYSKASMSANVPIDYTLVKYVKKPSGAAPGKVIYTHQQTVNVTPKKPDEKNA